MKSRIVCNTGPLIALSLIDCQHGLSQLYEPLIPCGITATHRRDIGCRRPGYHDLRLRM